MVKHQTTACGPEKLSPTPACHCGSKERNCPIHEPKGRTGGLLAEMAEYYDRNDEGSWHTGYMDRCPICKDTGEIESMRVNPLAPEYDEDVMVICDHSEESV